jgi:hypothetical protein
MFLGNQIFPLFTKYVSEKFKEKHQENPEFRSHKNKVDDFLLSYRTEARWNKAIQTLRDSGQLEMQPRDIPKIMQQVKNDILEEETANIKEELFELFMKDILTVAVRGLPEHSRNGWQIASKPNRLSKLNLGYYIEDYPFGYCSIRLFL